MGKTFAQKPPERLAKKIPVGVMAATGMVGQRFVQLLADHPWFRLETLTASERSSGKRYGDAVTWYLDTPLPKQVRELEIVETTARDLENCRVVFSALPADVAKQIELDLALNGHIVASNSAANRYEADVPILIPEINADHLDVLPAQRERFGVEGVIVTNSNCTVSGLALTLKPLADTYSLRRVIVTSLQALSGAGYDGVSAMAITDNVLPYIAREEEKVEREARKILGSVVDGARIGDAEIGITATCNRVGTLDGHLECVVVELGTQTDIDGLAGTFERFAGVPQALGLPTAPERPLLLRKEQDRPQPRFDRMAGSVPGMSVTIGRLRAVDLFGEGRGFRYDLLVHNTIRGAAGASVLNAELLYMRGYI